MACRTDARVVLTGQHPDADVRAEHVDLDDRARASFRLVTPTGHAEVRLGLVGAHHIGNALSAAAVAHELGASAEDIAARLSTATGRSAHRMDVRVRADGLTVVDDAYNANPESMAAALKALVGMSRGRRGWAVLGPMAELGDEHTTEHDRIGRLAVRLDVDRLVVVGEDARPMHQGACLEGSWAEESTLVPDAEAAVALLRERVRPEDVVLVKASNGFRLWTVAEALLVEHTGRDEHTGGHR
jgi:UDP-N-acetylmuramoyl-tripeptide--D-alanyl-D-alanine ligase